MATTRTMYIGHADQALVKIELGFFQFMTLMLQCKPPSSQLERKWDRFFCLSSSQEMEIEYMDWNEANSEDQTWVL